MRGMKTNILVAIIAGVLGGLVGAGVYALFDGSDESPRGSLVRFGTSFHDIETTPYCVQAQKFCLVQLESGEYRALYTYDTHDWARNQSCEITWRAEMLFRAPGTDVESQGWFRSGCSGTTYRYTGERVFGPGGRDMDQFSVELKTSSREGPDGSPMEFEYLEVDTRRLICGEPGNASIPRECDFAPLPQ